MHANNKIKWTKKQNDFLNKNKNGKFVVKACPGSGKTTSVSEKLFQMINSDEFDYHGIATISFTNVASDEIKSNLENRYNTKISFPHYIGTIDSFLNKYVFLPFGHLVMGCEDRPTLVGEPHGAWHGKYFKDSFFDKITYSIKGELVKKGRLSFQNQQEKSVFISKKMNNGRGYATQSDANYFSMKILEKYPNIAKIICRRFPYFIIDEAQDTSDIQMEIFNLLVRNGLNDIIFVGDPEQAIFEWNEAKPHLFNEKFNIWDKNSIVFNENFRSSDEICKFTSKLSDINYHSKSDIADFSMGKDIIHPYSDNINQIIKNFIHLCGQHNITISKDNVAVLFRSKEFAKTFMKSIKFKDININNIWKDGKDKNDKQKCSKDFLFGKFLWDNGNKPKGFKLIEKGMLKVNNGLNYVKQEDIKETIKELGFYSHRKSIMKLINFLPEASPNSIINDWILKTNEVFSQNNLHYNINDIKKSTKYKNFKDRLTFNDLFYDEENDSSEDYYIGTVHSVKGRTLDAVLLILKSKSANNKKYATLLNENTRLCDSEELRIVYVAITRPRKILQVAVPKNDEKQWLEFFNSYQTSLNSFF
ncbi:MAG: UvrD-helicase domain-containing protein [Methanobacteriaceae archaeon]